MLVSSFFTIQATSAQNYDDPHGPAFAGRFSNRRVNNTDTVTVVSYNIKYGQNIAGAIQEFDQIESLEKADIILLQEMDEIATEQFARAHGYNYVYFPAAIHPLYEKNFGNAILSKWPMRDSRKLILPHKSLTRRMTRQATKAIVTVGGTDILVYSIHAETAVSWPRFRWNQYATIIEDIHTEADYVIVGGDFNTVTAREISTLETKFADAGLIRASNGTGYSIIKLTVPVIMDHIFSKGFAVDAVGKVPEATASDHLPIWVNLRLP